MKLEDIVVALTIKVIEKVKMEEHPIDAGEQARGYYEDVKKTLEGSSVSQGGLQIALAILDKDEVKLPENDPAANAAYTYKEVIGEEVSKK